MGDDKIPTITIVLTVYASGIVDDETAEQLARDAVLAVLFHDDVGEVGHSVTRPAVSS